MSRVAVEMCVGTFTEGTSEREGTRARGHEGTSKPRQALLQLFSILVLSTPALLRALMPSCPRALLLAGVLLPALFTPFAATAQSGRIQVEVLVFAYNNPDTGSELAPSDADPSYTGMLLGENGEQYSALPSSALKLGGANDALARNARTRALVHFGWQQDGNATRPVRLRGRETVRSSDPEHGVLATELPELDGDINLRFGHGVEVHVDALLRVAKTDRSGHPSGERRFRLNDKRVMNYGELHYIDHPAFGVIVRVDPLDASGPVEAETAQ